MMLQRQLTRFVALLALAIGLPAVADTKLNDGTILSDKPTWIVTYIEVGASSADEAENLISKHATRSTEANGNLRFEALQRISRNNHFVILEAWQDPAARATHAASDSTVSFRQALHPLLYAPYDERPHVGLEATDPKAIPAGTPASVYVVTHADIIPPEQFAPCNRQVESSGPCGNQLLINIAKKSRDHAGNRRFDILTQSNRGNHMTVVEMWADAESQAAHQVHVDKTNFRDQLAGIAPGSGVDSDAQFIPNMMTGSLWDERLYRLISD